MTIMTLDQAVDHALGQAMAADDRILTWGEDVRLLRRNLLARFGNDRVRDTPISEGAFMYAGIGAAMAGLKPVVELYMIDFAAVGWAAIVNGASKFRDFSGGRWDIPLVIRAGAGGWYTDGGQHEQAHWGTLAAYPSTTVVVPSTPADAAGLMLTALQGDEFVVFLTPKLLDIQMLEYLAGDSRKTVDFTSIIPADGIRGEVPDVVEPIPFGKAAVRREGSDVALISLAVGVHRCLEAADVLADQGIQAEVVDLRTVAPLDREAIVAAATKTGRVVVVDEDYARAGLTGEVAALLLESGTQAKYARVAVEQHHPVRPPPRARRPAQRRPHPRGRPRPRVTPYPPPIEGIEGTPHDRAAPQPDRPQRPQRPAHPALVPRHLRLRRGRRHRRLHSRSWAPLTCRACRTRPASAGGCWTPRTSSRSELFEFRKPTPEPVPADWRPCDIGYTMIGIHVDDFDAILDATGPSPGRPADRPDGRAGCAPRLRQGPQRGAAGDPGGRPPCRRAAPRASATCRWPPGS